MFDASAKTTNGKLLNDILVPGVPMQNDLFEILLRFRKYLFVVTADIAKMYRLLGFLTPFATEVKVIIQKLWQLKLSWDESIPLDLRTR